MPGGHVKIVAVSMIGNEADVVECFVRHTLKLVDRLVIILHRSVDGTADIVRSLKEEGLPIQIEPVRFEGFSQGREMSFVAKALLAHTDHTIRANYVVPLDADEFLKLPSADYLQRALPAVPGEYFAATRWQNYFPMQVDDLINAHTLRAITHCRQDDNDPCYKVMLSPGFLHDRASLFEGSHCVMWETQTGHKPAPCIELKAIRLAHFPVRSRFQLARKAHIGALAKSLTSGNATAGLGTHWQGLLEQVTTHTDMTFERLQSVAFHYPQTFCADGAIDESMIAHSPMACNFDLRYSHLIRTDLEGILADWVRA